jgi:hypothetical protein
MGVRPTSAQFNKSFAAGNTLSRKFVILSRLPCPMSRCGKGFGLARAVQKNSRGGVRDAENSWDL